MTAFRIALCAVAVALGLGALALAHDVHSTRKAVDRGDARFATHPATARWKAETWLPQAAALRTLGLRDDLSLRRAERAFERVEAETPGLDDGRREAERRAGVQVALADVVEGGSPAQASRAGNLLGILLAAEVGAPYPTQDVRGANATFDAAIRADLSNVDAKHNLELLLRRMKVIGVREGAGGSIGGDYGQALAGAGAGLPGSGY